jgi:ADP-heptose:LPS heptosyltransferase
MNNLRGIITRKWQNVFMLLPAFVFSPFAVMRFVYKRMESSNIRPAKVKIIRIYRSAALGDIILTTAAIESIRNSYPEARIEFIVGKPYSAILKNNGLIAKIWEIEPGGGLSIIWKNINVLKSLIKEKADILLGLETSLSAALFGWATLPRFHVGDKWGMQRFIYDKTAHCRAGQSHLLNISLICKAAGIEDSFEKWRPRIYLEPEEREVAKGQLGMVGRKDGLLLALHPGGGNIHNPEVRKNWPARGFATVLSLIAQRFKFTTVLLSGPGEEPLANIIKQNYNGKIIDLSGRTTIRQLAAIIAYSDLFIGNDSAPGHMAAALNVPSVTVWGSSDPKEYGNEFQSIHHRIYASNLACRPCRRPTCLQSEKNEWQCLREVKEEMAVEAVISSISQII